MGYSDELFSVGICAAGYALYLLIIVIACFRADWARVSLEKSVQHIMFGGALALAGLWHIKAGLFPGLTIHLMGITVFALLLGWELALLTSCLAGLISIAFSDRSISFFALESLVSTVVPIVVTMAVVAWEKRMRFRLFFAYMYICGFFAAAFSAAATAITSALLLWGAGVYSAEVLVSEYLQYLPLMMLPEGFVNGIVTAGLVVYFPERLITFDQSRYE